MAITTDLIELTKVNYEEDVPPWIRELMDRIAETFRLHEWVIHVAMSDAPGGNAKAEGVTNLQTRYKRAWIELSRDSKDVPYWRSNVVHEITHVINAELTRMVDHLLSQLPEETRGFAQELFADVLEQHQERIARGLTLLLDPLPGKSVLAPAPPLPSFGA